jgi:hypothetical protein
MNKSMTLNKQPGFSRIISAILIVCAVVLGYEYVKPVHEFHTPETRVFNVAAARTAPGSQLPVLAVVAGDSLVVNISSKEPGAVMVHGFDDMPEVAPGRPAVFRMTATRSGRFSLHMHTEDGAQVEIATIEVAPNQ